MAFNINQFAGALKFGGARNTLFQVDITNPVEGVADIQVPFMVKTAQIPAVTMGTIEVPYFGRKMKLAGDKTYEDWSVTVINDEDFLIRNALESWCNAINGPETNLQSFASASPLQYKSTAQITQFSKTGVPLRVYSFINLYPQSIGQIDMNWESNDQIEEFEVTFSYDYHIVTGGITGNGGT
jgi:hypothetical protein